MWPMTIYCSVGKEEPHYFRDGKACNFRPHHRTLGSLVVGIDPQIYNLYNRVNARPIF